MAACDKAFFYLPPHRWLRKILLVAPILRGHLPPHRWLRKLWRTWKNIRNNLPPHRWLRKGKRAIIIVS
ncbi:hypothetical protein [uncultured Gammaproteobacteria bacterium]|nr:hypothetical protein [uncultured Gammaproteobacteria bacterium]